ncbi:MAG: glycerol-3-phosphate 1-O-acyltransferase PlsY [Fimbriimonadaceae bacterium]|nr:glycerol-3-phosphate 1-O-acyltransferase PlsY [Fimbriimonadaceae bacterium]
MLEAAVFVVSFLIGSIPFGLLIARRQGVDIRQTGSGNIGATNVWRTLGPKAGSLAFGLDVLKGLVPAALAHLVAPYAIDALRADLSLLAGVSAILGHVFSPWVGFRGGKGIATGLGALLGTAPFVGLAGFAVWWGVMFMLPYVSAASLVACVAVVAFGFLLRQTPLFLIIYGAVGVFVYIKHIPNIKRLIAGTEPAFRFGSSRSQPETPTEEPRP